VPQEPGKVLRFFTTASSSTMPLHIFVCSGWESLAGC
jgi:hypothetical protein